MTSRVSLGVVLTLAFAAVAATSQFTEWSTPVNLGPVVNSASNDFCVAISKNGLALIFASNRLGGVGGNDLYMSKRASLNDPWETPVLVPNVNSTAAEMCPTLSLDEHGLYFASNRPGGCGNVDIYVSRRHDRRDDFGWQLPENLGCEINGYINGAYGDYPPALFEDETGSVVMYFASGRPGGLGGLYDYYASTMRDDDTFGPGTLIEELSSPFDDGGMAMRRDGLEVIIGTTRPGGLGDYDLWVATRDSTSDPWSAPVHLPAPINTALDEGGKMSFSFDGRALYFRSGRPGGSGGWDLWVATREKLPGKKEKD